MYFTGGPHSPTTRQDWDDGIRALNDEAGIASAVPYSASVFLEAALLRASRWGSFGPGDLKHGRLSVEYYSLAFQVPMLHERHDVSKLFVTHRLEVPS